MADMVAATTLEAVDIMGLMKLLPHRYPFLMIDRIVDIDGDESAVGIKNVTINEPHFQGHFPDQPVMPGVLIVEAMAQAGGMLLMRNFDAPESRVVYFTALDAVRFRRPVLPGEDLVRHSAWCVKRVTVHPPSKSYPRRGHRLGAPVRHSHSAWG